jgi:hypothetical protein
MKNKTKIMIIFFSVCLIVLIQNIIALRPSTNHFSFKTKENSSLLKKIVGKLNFNGNNDNTNIYLFAFMQEINFCCYSGRIIQLLNNLTDEIESVNVNVLLPSQFSENDIKNLNNNYSLNINFFRYKALFQQEKTLPEMIVLLSSVGEILYETSINGKNEQELHEIKKEIIYAYNKKINSEKNKTISAK